MGAIDGLHRIHDGLAEVFFPLELLALLVLSFGLVVAVKKKLYPSFPANCFVVVLGLQIFYGVWLSLLRWMPGSPLKEELGFPASLEACYVVSFVDTALQMLLVTINTSQMCVIFYTLYLRLVMGQTQKEKLYWITVVGAIGVSLFVACFVLVEPSRSEMGWCVPGKMGTVVKVNVWFLLLIGQVIMVSACTYSLSGEDNLIPAKLRKNAMLRIWGMVISQVLGVFPLIMLEFLSVAQFPVPEGLGWWFIIGFPLSGMVDALFVFSRWRTVHTATKSGVSSVDLLSAGSSHASHHRLLSKDGTTLSKNSRGNSQRGSISLGSSKPAKGKFRTDGKGSFSRDSKDWKENGGALFNGSTDRDIPGLLSKRDGPPTTDGSVDSNLMFNSKLEQGKSLGSVLEEPASAFANADVNSPMPGNAYLRTEIDNADTSGAKEEEQLLLPRGSVPLEGVRLDNGSDVELSILASATGHTATEDPCAAPPAAPRAESPSTSRSTQGDAAGARSHGFVGKTDSPKLKGDRMDDRDKALLQSYSKSGMSVTDDEEFNRRMQETHGAGEGGCYVPIAVQMGLSLLLPAALLVGMIIAVLVGAEGLWAVQQRVESNVLIIRNADLLLTELALERSYTAAFLNSNGKNVTCKDVLGRSRHRVDASVADFLEFVRDDVTDVTLISDDHFVLSLAGMIHLDSLREDVDQLSITEQDGLREYTQLIEEFLGVYDTIAREVEGDVYQNGLIALFQFVAGKEAATSARVLGSIAFAEGSWKRRAEYLRFAALLASESVHETYFAGYSVTEVREYFETTVNDTAVLRHLDWMHAALLQEDNATMATVENEHYFGNMSAKVSLLLDVERFAADHLVHSAEDALTASLNELSVVVGVMFGCLLAAGFVILALGNAYGTFKSLEDQADKFDANASLQLLCCLNGCARKVLRMDKLLKLGNFALLLIGIVTSVLCVVMCSCQLIYVRVADNEKISVISTHAPLIRGFTDMVHEMQTERGNAALLLSASGRADIKYFEEEFQVQMEITDIAVAEVQKLLNMEIFGAGNPIVAHSEPLADIRVRLVDLAASRRDILKRSVSVAEASEAYRGLNEDVILFLGDITRAVTAEGYYADLALTIALAHLRDTMGCTQALGAAHIGHQKPFKHPGQHGTFARYVARDDVHIDMLRALAPHAADLNAVLRTAAFNTSSHMAHRALSGPVSSVSHMDGDKFFRASATVVKQFHEFQTAVEDRLHDGFEGERLKRRTTWIIWLTIGSAVFLLNFVVFDIAVGRVKLLEKLEFFQIMRQRRKRAGNKHQKMKSSNLSHAGTRDASKLSGHSQVSTNKPAPGARRMTTSQPQSQSSANNSRNASARPSISAAPAK